MESSVRSIGFGKCDSQTVKAVRVRRLGSLPAAMALGCCDIGEAVVQWEDGGTSMSLITWGKGISPDDQHWYSTTTAFQPVWCGCDHGTAELILGPSSGADRFSSWLRAGLELTASDLPWSEIKSD